MNTHKTAYTNENDNTADLPAGIGRGTGMTLKEMKRLLNAGLARMGIGDQRYNLKRRFVVPKECRSSASSKMRGGSPAPLRPAEWLGPRLSLPQWRRRFGGELKRGFARTELPDGWTIL